jgi:enediyne biosynthesis protein E4
VTLYWKNDKGQELMQLQQVQCASGFCAQNDPRLHFGLGRNPVLEKAVIRWPIAGGTTQTVTNLTPDKLWQIKEPS